MIRAAAAVAAVVGCAGAATTNVDAQLRAATRFDAALSNDTASPSFPASAPTHRCGPAKAAYVFAGHARTLPHTYASLVDNALGAFGADAYVFVYLTRDDPGSSRGFGAAADDAAAVAAVAALRPKRAVYAALAVAPPVLAAACELPGDDVVKTPSRAAGGGRRWTALWQTWAKVARGYGLVLGYEAAHGVRFDVVARLRADARFVLPLDFGACDLEGPGGIAVPLGVAGCTRPCVNDHLMWAPRASADAAFLAVVRDFDACRGPLAENAFRSLGDFGTYVRRSQNLSLKPPISLRLALFGLDSCRDRHAHLASRSPEVVTGNIPRNRPSSGSSRRRHPTGTRSASRSRGSRSRWAG